jgi:hypothetical protein
MLNSSEAGKHMDLKEVEDLLCSSYKPKRKAQLEAQRFIELHTAKVQKPADGTAILP